MHRWTNYYKVIKWTAALLVICGVVAPPLARAQTWTTRDPRFYSREGVHDYNPPSPGDPDYR